MSCPPIPEVLPSRLLDGRWSRLADGDVVTAWGIQPYGAVHLEYALLLWAATSPGPPETGGHQRLH